MQREYNFEVGESPTYSFNIQRSPTYSFRVEGSVVVQGTTDYNNLENRPKINGHTLEGDMDVDDLGIHIPEDVSELNNDRHFITHDEIFTDLGVVDSEPYDYDISAFFNTLTESGWYKFFWDNGDDYTYFVQVQSFEYDGVTYVNQHYWGNEEGTIAEYIRGFLVEDGDVVGETTDNYMTFESAYNTFASKGHVHYRTDAKAVSVWDYCDGQIRMQSDSPILYTDTLNGRQYVIETWLSTRQPTYNYQKVTDLIDSNVFYQRSGVYQSGRTTWGDWYKFSGTAFDPSA